MPLFAYEAVFLIRALILGALLLSRFPGRGPAATILLATGGILALVFLYLGCRITDRHDNTVLRLDSQMANGPVDRWGESRGQCQGVRHQS